MSRSQRCSESPRRLACGWKNSSKPSPEGFVGHVIFAYRSLRYPCDSRYSAPATVAVAGAEYRESHGYRSDRYAKMTWPTNPSGLGFEEFFQPHAKRLGDSLQR